MSAIATRIDGFTLRPATAGDAATVLGFIRELAEYERLAHEVVATEELLRETLFGARCVAEVVLGCERGEPVAFALFFHSFSTFLGRPGIYLEDLYVRPTHRGRGYGEVLLAWLARLAVDRGCGRLEWSVLDWNEPALRFYRRLGAVAMDEWTVHRLTGESLAALAGRFEAASGAGRG
ncbi:MAG TPA: GNAT family N-acetyltransferase [Thermoanaerobaculia bacterium]|nr:GNAT family N-acetyltransferase [Thermoanaerobaculia bacterium]